MLGLDRAPEAKTLRRKLAHLGTAGRSTQFGQALAEQRVGPARERLWISTTATVRNIGTEKSSAYCRMAEARLFIMRLESGI